MRQSKTYISPCGLKITLAKADLKSPKEKIKLQSCRSWSKEYYKINMFPAEIVGY